jgi:hypothetical protein
MGFGASTAEALPLASRLGLGLGGGGVGAPFASMKRRTLNHTSQQREKPKTKRKIDGGERRRTRGVGGAWLKRQAERNGLRLGMMAMIGWGKKKMKDLVSDTKDAVVIL